MSVSIISENLFVACLKNVNIFQYAFIFPACKEVSGTTYTQMKIPKICVFQYVILFRKKQKIIFLSLATFANIKTQSLKYFHGFSAIVKLKVIHT